nr:hypothetical protein [Tanacetum cinerariifolium]
MLLMEAKEKGSVLDAEAEAFLADVEYEGPHATTAFMANLSSTSGTNGATTSHVNESDIDDNMISYHRYQLDSEVQDVPTEEQTMVNDSLRAELARCKLEIQPLERNKVKHDLDTTIVQRNKRNAKLEQENVLLKSNLSQKVESINSLKTESIKVLSEKKDLEE